MNDSVKLARLELSREREKQAFEIAKLLLTNPAIELVLGFTLVELGQRYPTHKPLFTGVQGNLMQAGMAGIITAQQIAPLMPQIAAGGASLAKLLPAVL